MHPARLMAGCVTVSAAAFLAMGQTSDGYPEELLDGVLRSPGAYVQSCVTPPPLSLDVPLPVYSLGPLPQIRISGSNLQLLRDRGPEVAEVLVQRLRTMNFDPKGATRVDERPPVAADTVGELSLYLLQSIVGVRATQTLPELLRLEEDLFRRIEKAAAGDKAALPPVRVGTAQIDTGARVGFSRNFYQDPEGFKKEWEATRPQREADERMREENRDLFAARLFHRRILSVMLMLLREERFAPLLQSDLEKQYFDAISRRAEQPDLKNIRKSEDIPALQRSAISFDPIHGLPVRNWNTWGQPEVWAPYSSELRLQIRSWVADHLRQQNGETGSMAVPTK